MKYILKGWYKSNLCFEGDTGRIWFQMKCKTREEAEEARIERKDTYKDLSIEEVGD